MDSPQTSTPSEDDPTPLEQAILRLRGPVLCGICLLGAMCYAGNVQRKSDQGYQLSSVEQFVQHVNEVPEQAYGILSEQNRPSTTNQIQPDAPEEEHFVVGVDSIPINKDYLYSIYDPASEEFVVRLQNLKSKEIIQEWRVAYHILSDLYQEWLADEKPNYEMYGSRLHSRVPKRALGVPTLLSDGRVTVMVGRMLVCLEQDGHVAWSVNSIYHHSTEVDHEGNLWICSMLPNPGGAYRQDAIVQLAAATGQTLYTKSILEIFRENPAFDLSHLNNTEDDPFHLNDVQPVFTDTDYWKRGDLLISLRNISTVLLYRPSTGRVLWSNSTFWANQHDVCVVDDHRISVFDNNVLRRLFSTKEFKTGKHNRCMIYDFETGQAGQHFAEIYEAENIASPTQGRLKWFAKEHILYVEPADQFFFVVADLDANKSYKCVVPGYHPGKVGDVVWFRLLDKR